MILISRRNISLMAGVACAAALTAGAIISADAQEAPAIGAPAPDFTVETVSGETFSMADYADRTVVLEWVNPGCPYVQRHYNTGSIPSMQVDATADDVVWVAVNSTNPNHRDYLEGAELQAYVDEHGGAPSALILDPEGEIGRLYDARRTPDIFIVHEGEVAYIGAVDDRNTADAAAAEGATNYVRAALTSISAGEEIAQPETLRYGCTVKYS